MGFDDCDRILAQCVTFPATRAFYHQLRTTCNFWLFYNSVIIWTVLRENTCFFHSVATVIGKPQKFQITKLPTEIYCLRILTKKYSFTSANIHFPKNTTQEKNTQCGNFRSFFPLRFWPFFLSLKNRHFKTADFKLAKSSKLISRKIWVIEKLINFHTVWKSLLLLMSKMKKTRSTPNNTSMNGSTNSTKDQNVPHLLSPYAFDQGKILHNQ